jgi:hypothetical protein
MVDDEITEPPGPHRWLGYDNVVGGRFVARCSCGWLSSPFPTAGLAGSAWDAHHAEHAAEDLD